MAALVIRAHAFRAEFAIPATVIGQIWRDARRQALLAGLLGSGSVHIEVLDDADTRAAGQLCGVTGTTDVVDASVALCARARGHGVVTCDPDDIAHLDRRLRLVIV